MLTVVIITIGLDRIKKIERKIQKCLCIFIQFFLCLIILLTMIYQLEFTSNNIFITNCTFAQNITDTIDPMLIEPNDNLNYIGFKKTTDIGYSLSVSCFILFYACKNFKTRRLFIDLHNHLIDLDISKNCQLEIRLLLQCV